MCLSHDPFFSSKVFNVWLLNLGVEHSQRQKMFFSNQYTMLGYFWPFAFSPRTFCFKAILHCASQQFVTLYGKWWPNHPQEKQLWEGMVVAWWGLQNIWENKRSEQQTRQGKITQWNADFQRIARRDKKVFVSEKCKNSKKIINCKEYRSLQETWRYNRNTSCKNGHNKGQKIQRHNRSRWN